MHIYFFLFSISFFFTLLCWVAHFDNHNNDATAWMCWSIFQQQPAEKVFLVNNKSGHKGMMNNHVCDILSVVGGPKSTSRNLLQVSICTSMAPKWYKRELSKQMIRCYMCTNFYWSQDKSFILIYVLICIILMFIHFIYIFCIWPV